MFLDVFTRFAAACNLHTFFLIPSWYEYYNKAGYVSQDKYGGCIIDPQFIKNGTLNLTSVSLLGLGILDILLRLGALLAVGYIIYAGFQYITTQGEPEKAKHALGTIINALIGLGITIVAAASVRFVGERIGGGTVGAKTKGGIDVSTLPNPSASNATLITLYNTVIGLFGATALIVLVIAGLRYVSSNGDPGTMAKTKNTIIYSAIGLVVSLVAFTIVNYALSHI
ncbi:MAG TPA: pilin [Bacillota bacterium]|nr:pilin [Bacillota bacterium]